MYDDDERKINWLGILKRVVIIIIILLVIFGIITMVNKCTKKETTIKKVEEPIVNLKSQITDVQNATLRYLNIETLPLTINQTKTIKLKYLINKDLIGNLKDSKGNTCDTDATYSEVTKLSNNYALKTVVNCGKNTDYSVIYIGCFKSCDDDICIGSESDTDGICSITKDETNTNDNKNGNTTKTTKSTTKTTTTTKTPTKVLYEYKKTNYNYYCTTGELVGKECRTKEIRIYEGLVNETINPKTTTYSVNANTQVVSFTNPSNAKNTASATYEFINYKDGKYNYNKYTCSKGTLNGKVCTVTTTTNEVVKSCKDNSYTYNASDNTCTKKMLVTLLTDAESYITYDYTWSEKTSLSGWTKTGRTK